MGSLPRTNLRILDKEIKKEVKKENVGKVRKLMGRIGGGELKSFKNLRIGNQRKSNNGMVRSVAAPAAAYGARITSTRPIINHKGDITTFKYRELLGPVSASPTWQISAQYALNPGVGSVSTTGVTTGFAPLAVNLSNTFIEYSIDHLAFEFVPDVNTSVSGNIQMAYTPDVTLQPPTNPTMMLDLDGAVMGSVWENLPLYVDVTTPIGGKWKLIRNTAVAGDQHLFDYGTVFFATNNVALVGGSDTVVGNIFVEYCISFRKPKLEPVSFLPRTASSFYRHSTSGAQTITKLVETLISFDTNLFGTTEFKNNAVTTVSVDPLMWWPTIAGSNTFTPPAGTYFISFAGYAADDTSESNQVIVNFVVGGSAYPDPTINAMEWTDTGPAGAQVGISMSQVVSFNGSQTFAVQIYMTGAAGVLTLTFARLQVILV